jgi:hypothetical protein
MLGAVSEMAGVAFIIKSLFNQDMKIENTWIDSTFTDTGKMKMKNVSNFKVSNVESEIATIVYNSTVSINGTIEQMGQEMLMSNSSKVNGVIKVNIKTGIILENTSDSIDASNIEAAGMSIPSSGTTKTVIKVIAE